MLLYPFSYQSESQFNINLNLIQQKPNETNVGFIRLSLFIEENDPLCFITNKQTFVYDEKGQDSDLIFEAETFIVTLLECRGGSLAQWLCLRFLPGRLGF